MRRIRIFRRPQLFMSLSRVSRIFIAVCVSSMCVLGIRTFMSTDSNVSRRATGTSDFGSKNESSLVHAPLNDGAVNEALRKTSILKVSQDTTTLERMDSKGDSEMYPGFLEEKPPDGKLQLFVTRRTRPTLTRPDQKMEGFLMAKPTLVATGPDELGDDYDNVRRFPGAVDEVTELPLANRTRDAHLKMLSSHQKLPQLQLVNNGQNPWVPIPGVNQGGQIQLKVGPGSMQPGTQFLDTPPFGYPGNVPQAQFYVPPNAPPGNDAYFSPANGQQPQQQQPLGKDPLPVQQKLVHFDLKGAPPKVSYFKEIFPVLKKLGATGVLMEYEDMYPFTGPYKIVRALNAYSRGDIALINQLAAENQLMVIPLVQTFGHLEFVLKHEPFKHIREIDNYVSAVCPSRNESFGMVVDLIDQVLAMHPNVTYLHIGADEVFQLGACPICSERVKQHPATGKHELFLYYIAQLLTHLRWRYPHIKPIMWDDMFHNMNPQTIRDGLGDLVNYVEPMIWSYFTSWTNHLPQNGMLYGPIFPNIWGATAFKGSDGETRQMPDIRTQVGIHTSWLEALRFGGRNFQNFRGIALTGWSRYDHFYPLCELFPVSIPALAISIEVLNQNALTLPGVEEASKILNCQVVPTALSFMDFDPLLEQYTSCNFPGIDVYRSVHMLKGIEKPVKDYLEELTGKFPEYQMRHGYLQAWRVPEIISKLAGYEGLYEGYKQKAREGFALVFDEGTYQEWMAINVDPFLKKLQAWRSLFEDSLKNSTWPARPLFIPQLPVKEPSTQFPAKNPFLPDWSPPPPLINLVQPPVPLNNGNIAQPPVPLNNGNLAQPPVPLTNGNVAQPFVPLNNGPGVVTFPRPTAAPLNNGLAGPLFISGSGGVIEPLQPVVPRGAFL